MTGEVLHGINLSIQPGTVNALVGPSGSGKSTLAKLIAGFWNVTGGSITLGGTVSARYRLSVKRTDCLCITGKLSV